MYVWVSLLICFGFCRVQDFLFTIRRRFYFCFFQLIFLFGKLVSNLSLNQLWNFYWGRVWFRLRQEWYVYCLAIFDFLLQFKKIFIFQQDYDLGFRFVLIDKFIYLLQFLYFDVFFIRVLVCIVNFLKDFEVIWMLRFDCIEYVDNYV